MAVLWIPHQGPELENPDRIQIVWFNMKFDSEALRTLEKRLAENPPDILAIGEIGPKTEVHLPGYTFQLRSPKHDILIVSRLPLEFQQLIPVPGGGREQLNTRVAVGRRRFQLTALHLRQPIFPVHFAEIRQATATANKFEDTILVGDFNTSPWGAPFHQLCSNAGLHHGREGRGLLNSWAMGSGRWIPLPIDHMLYKGAIRLENFEVLDWTTSDHRPIRGTFLIGTKRRRQPRGDL